MQMKILRKPQIAASIAITLDILMLAAAMVLSSLRDRFPAEYTYDKEHKLITSSHPYDMFGIIAAAALAVAAVMTAFIIVGAFSDNKKTSPRIAGGIMLIIFSAAAILFSWLVIRGEQPKDTNYLSYTNNTHRIIIAEEKYRDDYGVAKFFAVNNDSGEARLVASTDITTFTEDNQERYTLQWISDTTLHISFIDGYNGRELSIEPYK